jgi:hypothetical protein
MTIISDPQDEVQVEIAEQAEIDEAVQRELSALGLTFADLERQAETEEFTSERARRLWFFVAPLD